MIFHVCDGRGRPIGEIADADLLSAVQKEERNGSDIVELRSRVPLEKGQRIVWREDAVYRRGRWHEHIVASADAAHGSGFACEAKCKSSVNELDQWYLVDVRPSGTASDILAALLSSTDWGSLGVAGDSASYPTRFYYHQTVLDALGEFEEACIADQTRFMEADAAPSGVTARRIGYRSAPEKPVARFEYGYNLADASRRIAPDPVCTALYGWGKGEEVGDGYSRKVSFDTVNGGIAWVGDEEARGLWGRRDGGHAFGDVEFPDVDDPHELLRLTRAELQRTRFPRTSYTGAIRLLEKRYGVERVELGDWVDVVDAEFPGGFRETLRVEGAAWDLLDPPRSTVDLGEVPETIEKAIARQSRALRRIDRRF